MKKLITASIFVTLFALLATNAIAGFCEKPKPGSCQVDVDCDPNTTRVSMYGTGYTRYCDGGGDAGDYCEQYQLSEVCVLTLYWDQHCSIFSPLNTTYKWQTSNYATRMSFFGHLHQKSISWLLTLKS